MNLKHLALGLAFLVPSLAYSPDASAGTEYASCSHKKDDDKRAKCNKNHAKYLKKQQSKTEPLVPSMISDKLADYDAAEKNPFATDDWYYGTVKTGVESVDSLTTEIYKAAGAIKMARYIGYLHKNGDKEEAVKLAGIVLPELVNLKNVVNTLKEKVAAVQGELTKDPKALLKAKSAANVLAMVPKLPADLAGALKAVTPLAKGSGAAAADMATDAVKKKAGGK